MIRTCKLEEIAFVIFGRRCVYKKVSYRKQIARQHSCRKKKFGQSRRRGRPGKMFLLSSLIAMQKTVAVSRTECACAESPRTLRDAGAPPLVMGGDPLETCPAHVLPYRIWSFQVKRYERTTGAPPPAPMMGVTPRNMFYQCGTIPRSNGTSVLIEIYRKNLALSSGLSRSLKVIGTNMIGYLWLPINDP